MDNSFNSLPTNNSDQQESTAESGTPASVLTIPTLSQRAAIAQSQWAQKTRYALTQAKHVAQFKAEITQCLQRLGFFQWLYARLDMPPRFCLGELVTAGLTDFVNVYNAEAFYTHDLAIKHTQHDNNPILQSDIDQHITASPYNTEEKRVNIALSEMAHRLRVFDCVNIPVVSNTGHDRASLSICTKNMDAVEFRRRTSRHLIELYYLAYTIEDIGCKHFPDIFLGSKTQLDKFLNSKAFKTFKELVLRGETQQQTAKRLNLSVATVELHVSRVREALGVNNTHSAIVEAMRSGLLQ